MKVMDIILFLFIINISVAILGNINLISLNVDVNETFNPESYETSDITTILLAFGFTITGLIAGITAGAMTSWLTRIPTDKGFIYGIFGGTFLGMLGDSAQVLLQFANSAGGGVATMIVIAFLIVVGILFVVGFSQLVTGGWRGYK